MSRTGITSWVVRLSAAASLVLGSGGLAAHTTAAQPVLPPVQDLGDQASPVQDPSQDSYLENLDIPPEGIARLYQFSGGGGSGAGTACFFDGVHPLNSGSDSNSPDTLQPCVLSPLDALNLFLPS